MRTVLIILGLTSPYFLIKYREPIGDTIGEAQWMRKVGGINVIIITISLFFFFWALAAVTGTTEVFLKPLQWLAPGLMPYSDPNAL